MAAAGEIWHYLPQVEGSRSGAWSMAFGDGMFVTLARTFIATSPDGIHWHATDTDTDAFPLFQPYAIGFGNGMFVAASDLGGNPFVTSPDGVNWTAHEFDPENHHGVESIAYGNGRWVAVVSTGEVWSTNSDLAHWDTSHIGDPGAVYPFDRRGWHTVRFGNGLFVAVTDEGNVTASSPDGITWTLGTLATGPSSAWLQFGDGKFLVACDNPIVPDPTLFPVPMVDGRKGVIGSVIYFYTWWYGEGFWKYDTAHPGWVALQKPVFADHSHHDYNDFLFVMNGKIYDISCHPGYWYDTDIGHADVYDPATNSWTNVAQAKGIDSGGLITITVTPGWDRLWGDWSNAPSYPLFHQANCVACAADKLWTFGYQDTYAFGSEPGDGDHDGRVWKNDLWCWDPLTDVWSQHADCPAILQICDFTVTVGSKFYAFGIDVTLYVNGTPPTVQPPWRPYVYNAATDSWFVGAAYPYGTGLNTSYPPSNVTASYWQGSIYFLNNGLGGGPLSGAAHFYRYNTVTDSWSELTYPFSETHKGSVIAGVGSGLFAWGGYGAPSGFGTAQTGVILGTTSPGTPIFPTADPGAVLSSTNGTDWTVKTHDAPWVPNYYGAYGAMFGEGIFIAYTFGIYNAWISTDGAEWRPTGEVITRWQWPTGYGGGVFAGYDIDGGFTQWSTREASGYLRMNQRDDGRGVERNPRLSGTGVNNPSSRQLGKPRRLGTDSNTYS